MRGREKVLVLYNEPVLPENHPNVDSEADILLNVVAVSDVLVKEGYDVRTLGIAHDPRKLIETVRDWRPAAVFNLFEGLPNHYLTEAYVAGVLAWLQVPFTGCPATALLLAQQKHLSKQLFRGAGIPTAPFQVVDSLPVVPGTLRWPLIIKPATQDSSVGIDQGSVVLNQEQLEARVERLLGLYGAPVLVEEFIEGRELTVGIVELPQRRVLPITEVRFHYDRPGVWPILSYDAKWSSSTSEYQETDYQFDVAVEPDLRTRLHEIALMVFQLLGARDCARADFRVRGSEVFLLEMNPNPSFAPDRGLTWVLGAAGLSHHAFTLRLLHNALERGERSKRDETQSCYNHGLTLSNSLSD